VAELTVHAFTVHDMIARGAAVYGDGPAVIQGERVLSFRALQDRVDDLAAGLAALGLAPGDRICVLAQNDAAYLELYGACARQGLIAYPINWRLTAQEVELDQIDVAGHHLLLLGQVLPAAIVAGFLVGRRKHLDDGHEQIAGARIADLQKGLAARFGIEVDHEGVFERGDRGRPGRSAS